MDYAERIDGATVRGRYPELYNALGQSATAVAGGTIDPSKGSRVADQIVSLIRDLIEEEVMRRGLVAEGEDDIAGDVTGDDIAGED